jgi:hypothetical protein
MKPRRKRTDARRSISVKGITYQWLKDYCRPGEPDGRSISGLMEEIIAKHLEAEGCPKPEFVNDTPRKKAKDFENERPAGNYFTF